MVADGIRAWAPAMAPHVVLLRERYEMFAGPFLTSPITRETGESVVVITEVLSSHASSATYSCVILAGYFTFPFPHGKWERY